MKAKNRYERAQQVLNWIDYNWPIGRRVVLMWKAKLQDSVFGETYRKGNVLYTISLANTTRNLARR